MEIKGISEVLPRFCSRGLCIKKLTAKHYNYEFEVRAEHLLYLIDWLRRK
jgi:hypothetical protein